MRVSEKNPYRQLGEEGGWGSLPSPLSSACLSDGDGDGGDDDAYDGVYDGAPSVLVPPP